MKRKVIPPTHMLRVIMLFICLLLYDCTIVSAQQPEAKLSLKKVIRGRITPKSVVHSGKGLFFAQNMMYKHTITVYNRKFELVHTLSDKIRLSDYGIEGYPGIQEGAPVEAAFSPDGNYAWISNYEMSGKKFDNPGTDNCKKSNDYDKGFVYKVNTKTFTIEAVIQAGCIPKYIAVTPNGQYVLVSNWCSGDLSIIEVSTETEIERINIGQFPRGIVIDAYSQYAYVTVMGSSKMAIMDLSDFSVSYISNIGKTPRHICLGPNEQTAYISLSREGKVIKLNLNTSEIEKSVATGKGARSMVISPNGDYIYVVNYTSATVAKVRTSDMKVVSKVDTHPQPIGITLDPVEGTIWVACYSGSIMVFEDPNIKPSPFGISLFSSTVPFDTLINPLERIEKETRVYSLMKQGLPYATQIQERREDLVLNNQTPQKKLVKESQKGYYCVIVGSFVDKPNALKEVKKMSTNGLRTNLLAKAEGGFRIVYGRFLTREAAVLATKLLKNTYKIDGWILNVKN